MPTGLTEAFKIHEASSQQPKKKDYSYSLADDINFTSIKSEEALKEALGRLKAILIINKTQKATISGVTQILEHKDNYRNLRILFNYIFQLFTVNSVVGKMAYNKVSLLAVATFLLLNPEKLPEKFAIDKAHLEKLQTAVLKYIKTSPTTTYYVRQMQIAINDVPAAFWGEGLIHTNGRQLFVLKSINKIHKLPKDALKAPIAKIEPEELLSSLQKNSKPELPVMLDRIIKDGTIFTTINKIFSDQATSQKVTTAANVTDLSIATPMRSTYWSINLADHCTDLMNAAAKKAKYPTMLLALLFLIDVDDFCEEATKRDVDPMLTKSEQEIVNNAQKKLIDHWDKLAYDQQFSIIAFQRLLVEYDSKAWNKRAILTTRTERETSEQNVANGGLAKLSRRSLPQWLPQAIVLITQKCKDAFIYWRGAALARTTTRQLADVGSKTAIKRSRAPKDIEGTDQASSAKIICIESTQPTTTPTSQGMQSQSSFLQQSASHVVALADRVSSTPHYDVHNEAAMLSRNDADTMEDIDSTAKLPYSTSHTAGSEMPMQYSITSQPQSSHIIAHGDAPSLQMLANVSPWSRNYCPASAPAPLPFSMDVVVGEGGSNLISYLQFLHNTSHNEQDNVVTDQSITDADIADYDLENPLDIPAAETSSELDDTLLSFVEGVVGSSPSFHLLTTDVTQGGDYSSLQDVAPAADHESGYLMVAEEPSLVLPLHYQYHATDQSHGIHSSTTDEYEDIIQSITDADIADYERENPLDIPAAETSSELDDTLLSFVEGAAGSFQALVTDEDMDSSHTGDNISADDFLLDIETPTSLKTQPELDDTLLSFVEWVVGSSPSFHLLTTDVTQGGDYSSLHDVAAAATLAAPDSGFRSGSGSFVETAVGSAVPQLSDQKQPQTLLTKATAATAKRTSRTEANLSLGY